MAQVCAWPGQGLSVQATPAVPHAWSTQVHRPPIVPCTNSQKGNSTGHSPPHTAVPEAGLPPVTPHPPVTGVFVGVGVGGGKHPQPRMLGLLGTVNVWQFSPAGQIPPQMGGDPLNPHDATVGVGVGVGGAKHPQPRRLGLPVTVNVWQFSPSGHLPPQMGADPLNPHGIMVGVGVAHAQLPSASCKQISIWLGQRLLAQASPALPQW